MNHDHDDLAAQLGRQMRHEVEGLDRAPLSLADVKGRATRIRRRRAALTGAGTAAVLAIVVPMAMLAGQFTNAGDDVGPATDPPSVSPGPTEPPDQGPVVGVGESLDTADLPIGDVPAVTWLENGSVLHTADGENIRLEGTYEDVVRYDDGWLGIGGGLAVLLDADGAETGESWVTARNLATGQGGDVVLFVADGELRLHDNVDGETTVLRDGMPDTAEMIGVDDEDTAAYNLVGPQGEPFAALNRDGEETIPDPGTDAYVLNDVTEAGWVSAITQLMDDGTCSRTVAPNGDVAGETCELMFDRFSPDQRHVIAGPAYADGYGAGQLAVLPVDFTDGDDPVLELLQSGARDATLMSWGWEDDDHILVVTATPVDGSTDMTWQLVRIGLDGTVENAATPVRGDEFAFPFALTS
ncbi:hypothetical protein [Nocardioides donggukensis]|uniref:Uncharacterized protein n=1 Tax=Nocardioides donggukensis TaxID=2774019 RepID=A0A927Q071_9ACTN|nr:hypothetical protein [Nocardioides donggukensis]MBD8868547.1 hypothetical protein [Nocardioides donggukensis]